MIYDDLYTHVFLGELPMVVRKKITLTGVLKKGMVDNFNALIIVK